MSLSIYLKANFIFVFPKSEFDFRILYHGITVSVNSQIFDIFPVQKDHLLIFFNKTYYFYLIFRKFFKR